MSSRISRLTWLEYLAGLLCVVLVLHFVFAGPIRVWEREALGALGFGDGVKLLVAVPAAGLVLYWRFRRRRWTAEGEGSGIPPWLMAMDMLVVLLGAGAVLWMAAV